MAASKLSSEFSDVKRVGKGAFGEVFRGKEKSSGKIYALKVLEISGSALKEIDVLRQIKHPNIVEYIRSFSTDDTELCIVMEYCSGGTLNDYLASHPHPEPSRDRTFMRQIASAVAFLHSNGIVHRDLKPDNILLDANGTLKVADFGLAKIIAESKCGGYLLGYYMGTRCGTPYFTAPEVYSGHYTMKSDIFSLGVIFACILLRKPYLVSPSGNSIGKALYQNMPGLSVQDVLNISPEYRPLIKKMLDRLPSCRPTADEVKAKLGA